MPEDQKHSIEHKSSDRKRAAVLVIAAILIVFVSLILFLVWLPSPAEGQTLRFSSFQQFCVGGSFAAGMLLLTFGIFRFVVGNTGGFPGFVLKIIGVGVLAAGIGMGAMGGFLLWAALSSQYEYRENSGGDFDWD